MCYRGGPVLRQGGRDVLRVTRCAAPKRHKLLRTGSLQDVGGDLLSGHASCGSALSHCYHGRRLVCGPTNRDGTLVTRWWWRVVITLVMPSASPCDLSSHFKSMICSMPDVVNQSHFLLPLQLFSGSSFYAAKYQTIMSSFPMIVHSQLSSLNKWYFFINICTILYIYVNRQHADNSTMLLTNLHSTPASV